MTKGGKMSKVRACIECGSEFTIEEGVRGRPPKCCSDSCRYTRQRKSIKDWQDKRVFIPSNVGGRKWVLKEEAAFLGALKNNDKG
jgi:hypothetical protein